MKRNVFITGGIVTLAAIGILGAGFVWSGFYSVAADENHTAPVHAMLDTLRERSIAVHAEGLQPPFDLSDHARIRQGAGNYNAMCMGCHLAPGMGETEMSRGLYPAPPDLTRNAVDAAESFWVIKHGIKASGMPAWGESMADEYIWNMAAFLQELPRLDAAQYQALVDSSGGHDHGGDETKPHGHPEGVAEDHHGPAAGTPASGSAPGMVEHRHADGTVESHPAPQAKTQTTKADDGHDHEH